jgi:hypothetical protein
MGVPLEKVDNGQQSRPMLGFGKDLQRLLFDPRAQGGLGSLDFGDPMPPALQFRVLANETAKVLGGVELWLRLYKKESGVATVTCAEAPDESLCYGWIDAVKKSYDTRERQGLSPEEIARLFQKFRNGVA